MCPWLPYGVLFSCCLRVCLRPSWVSMHCLLVHRTKWQAMGGEFIFSRIYVGVLETMPFNINPRARAYVSFSADIQPYGNFNPEARPFLPGRKEHHVMQRGRNKRLGMRRGQVPDHYVGVSRRHLTDYDWWEIKKWRRGTNRCEGCGVFEHDTVSCPRWAKRFRKLRPRNACFECGSAMHAVEDCEMRKLVLRQLGRLAMEGEVPSHLVGAAYAYMTTTNWEDITVYRMQHGVCLQCAASIQSCTCAWFVMR